MSVSEIEKDLLTVTGFKPTKGMKRQDVLGGLIRAVSKLKDDAYDNLSDGAAGWCDKAIDAMNDKDPIPDFDEEEVEGDPEEAETSEGEEGDEAETDDTEEQAEGDDEPEAEDDAEAEEAPAPKKGAKANGKQAKVVAKAKAEVKKPAKRSHDTGIKGKADPERYAKITGEKDKWGVTAGTKTSDALAMYEKGVTASKLKEELGGRFYNVLKQMKEAGHSVEKSEDGNWKLTHKDDLGSKPVKKKK